MQMLPHSSRPVGPNRMRGFTLLEMMLVMLILTLLVGAIVGVVRGTVELADDMTVEQAREARIRGFATYCERMFRTLPSGARVALDLEKRDQHYLSRLSFRHVEAGVGAWRTSDKGNVILETEEVPGGDLRVVLKMVPAPGDGEPVRLVLLEGVTLCEWEFHNPVTDGWESVWNQKQTSSLPPEVSPAASLVRRPGLVTLKLKLGAGSTRSFVFWTPPASTPKPLPPT